MKDFIRLNIEAVRKSSCSSAERPRRTSSPSSRFPAHALPFVLPDNQRCSSHIKVAIAAAQISHVPRVKPSIIVRNLPPFVKALKPTPVKSPTPLSNLFNPTKGQFASQGNQRVLRASPALEPPKKFPLLSRSPTSRVLLPLPAASRVQLAPSKIPPSSRSTRPASSARSSARPILPARRRPPEEGGEGRYEEGNSTLEVIERALLGERVRLQRPLSREEVHKLILRIC